jgi:glycosyltransferase involved in cell wall biosynthesis
VTKNPFLSIVTVNFNNLEGLNHTIKSVLNQSWKDFEYIIIDGGSTDGSSELISEMSKSFSYSISEPDNGIYNAMNKGAKVASGDYLYFLNSGDYLAEENVLDKVYKEITAQNEQTQKKDIFVGSTRQESFAILISPPETVTMYELFKSTLPHQGMFLPRDKVLKYPFQEQYKIVADWIQCVEILKEGLIEIRTFQNTTLIAINEAFGTCSELNVKLEKNIYIEQNQHVFRRFEDYQSIRFKYDQIKNVANANLLNRILWKVMRMLVKQNQ